MITNTSGQCTHRYKHFQHKNQKFFPFLSFGLHFLLVSYTCNNQLSSSGYRLPNLTNTFDQVESNIVKNAKFQKLFGALVR